MINEPVGAVREALRLELTSRGYCVAKDTAGSDGELYIRGDGDRAAALFAFKSSAEEACLTMYQGSWPATLPPRFAVMPYIERCSPDVDMLLQVGLSVLFYESRGEEVAFLELEEALSKIGVDQPV